MQHILDNARESALYKMAQRWDNTADTVKSWPQSSQQLLKVMISSK